MTDSTRTSDRLLSSIRKAKATDAQPSTETTAATAAPASPAPRRAPVRKTATKKVSPRRVTTAMPASTGAKASTPSGHRLAAVINPQPDAPANTDPYSRGGRVWPD